MMVIYYFFILLFKSVISEWDVTILILMQFSRVENPSNVFWSIPTPPV